MQVLTVLRDPEFVASWHNHHNEHTTLSQVASRVEQCYCDPIGIRAKATNSVLQFSRSVAAPKAILADEMTKRRFFSTLRGSGECDDSQCRTVGMMPTVLTDAEQ